MISFSLLYTQFIDVTGYTIFLLQMQTGKKGNFSSYWGHFILTKYKLHIRNYYLNWNKVTQHAVEWVVNNWQTQRVTKQTRQVYQCFSLVGWTTKNKTIWLSLKLTTEHFPYNVDVQMAHALKKWFITKCFLERWEGSNWQTLSSTISVSKSMKNGKTAVLSGLPRLHFILISTDEWARQALFFFFFFLVVTETLVGLRTLSLMLEPAYDLNHRIIFKQGLIQLFVFQSLQNCRLRSWRPSIVSLNKSISFF